MPAPDGAGCFRLQLHGLDIEFSQGDAVERMMIFTEVPGLLHQILASIGIMEQAGVEAHAIDTDCSLHGRGCPRSDQIVRAILERAVDDLHIRVDEPEFAVRVGQVRRQMPPPDGLPSCPTGKRGLRARAADSSEPCRGIRANGLPATSQMWNWRCSRCRDANHRGICVESGEYGIGDLHGFLLIEKNGCRGKEERKRLKGIGPKSHVPFHGTVMVAATSP